MSEKEIDEIVLKLRNERNTSVLLVSGPEGAGKTHAVLNAFSKFNVKYFQYIKGEDNYKKLLDILNLSDAINKYLKITNAFSPTQAIKSVELINLLLMNRLEELKNEGSSVLIADNLEDSDHDFLILFFNIASKYLKENASAKIIGIYDSSIKNEELQNIIEILKTFGATEIKLNLPSLKSASKIIAETGYSIPEKVISLFYESSQGNLKKIFQYIKLLENNGFIIEKTFIKSITESTISEIKGIITAGSEKRVLETLTPDEIIVTIYLALLGESIDPVKLMEIMKMEENNFVNAVDNLVRKKIVVEKGDLIEIREKEFESYVEKAFSRLKLKDARLGIARYLEEKGDRYRAGLQYYQAGDYDRAYELLVESGNEYYQSGDFYRALNAFTAAYKIKKTNREVNRKLVEILTIAEETDKILEITGEIMKNDPGDVENVLNYANVLHKKSEYRESKKYYEMAQEMAENIRDKVKAQYGIGRYYYTVENNEKAREILNDALKNAREAGEHTIEAKILRILGNIEYENQNFPMALHYYELAKRINESTGNYYDLSSTYNNIANVSSETNLKEGKYYYTKAREIAEKYWFPSLLETLYINVGILNEYEGNVKEAVHLFKRALGTSMVERNYETAIIAILNLLDPLVKMGNIDDAENFLNKGLEIAKAAGKVYEEKELSIFQKLMKKIRGEDVTWFEEAEEMKKSGIKYYINFAEVSIPMYYYYSGETMKAMEIYENYIKERLENLNTDMMIDLIDFIELLEYVKFFNGIENGHVKKYIEIVEGSDLLPQMNFVAWRFNIIKAVELLDEKKKEEAMKMFNENIKYLESQELRYLVSRLKLLFGMYLLKNFGDRKIIDDAKKDVQSLKLKGVEKALEKALSL